MIEGNFIGTDPSGKLARGNVRTTSLVAAVVMDNLGSRIGGTSTGARNIISGNRTGGIFAGDCCGHGNSVIQGNFIGVDATGTNALGNGLIGLHGVWVKGFSHVIGGSNSIFTLSEICDAIFGAFSRFFTFSAASSHFR